MGAYLPEVRWAPRGAESAVMPCSIMMRKHPENVLYRKADFAQKSGRLRQSRNATSRGPVPWVRLSVVILLTGTVLSAADAPGPFVPRYTIIDVGTLGGFGSAALAINDLGQMCGGADRSDGLRRAFLWTDGEMVDPGTFAQATQGESNDVNNKGQGTGTLFTSFAGVVGAFFGDAVEIINLGDLTGVGAPTKAFAINGSGQVVGTSKIPLTQFHSFVRPAGLMTDLGTLGGALCFAGLQVDESKPDAAEKPNEPDIERLVKDLISQEAKVAREARKQLERMAHAVPVLFKKLVATDWDLKPPLLEVLARIHGGRDYARLKLFHGTPEEKTYAALLYELIDQGEDSESREYPVMVEVLLEALKSEDKYLRAAAGRALIHYEEDNTAFFEHFHEIVPVLISSFDTDLVIDRRHRDDPTQVVFIGISMWLDVMIGDRMAYLDVESNLWKTVGPLGDDHLELRRGMVQVLTANREDIENLRAYWQEWWNKHRKMSVVEIGRLIIERNLRFIPEPKPTRREMIKWPLAKREQYRLSEWSLELWTGEYFLPHEDSRKWWTQHKAAYKGPIRRRKE